MKRQILVSSVIALTLSLSVEAFAAEGDTPAVPALAPVTPSPLPAAAQAMAPVTAAKPSTGGAQATPGAGALAANVPAPAIAAKSVAVVAPAAPVNAPAAQVTAPLAQVTAPLAQATATTGTAESTLPVRVAKPLELAPPTTSTSWGTPLALVGLLGAGALAWVRLRKKEGRRGDLGLNKVRVLSRTSVALRSEVAVVEAGGLRLLIGVTPSSIQTLAVLPEGDVEAEGLAAGMADEERERPSRREMPRSASSEGARLGSVTRGDLESEPSLADRARSLFTADAPRRTGASLAGVAKYAERAGDSTRSVADATRDLERDDDERENAGSKRLRSNSERAARASDLAIERALDRSERMERDGADRSSRHARAASSSVTPATRASSAPIEGQARGLVLALGNKR